MDANEARILLGFPPNSNPSPSQVKSAYKQKVWESHPDLFPSHEKPLAESKFKLEATVDAGIELDQIRKLYPTDPNSISKIKKEENLIKKMNQDICEITESITKKMISEAYTCLLPGGRGETSTSAEYWRVVRTGVPRANGGRKNHAMIKVPFLLLILGTVALGGFNASRAYKRQKEDYPSHNPFLP